MKWAQRNSQEAVMALLQGDDGSGWRKAVVHERHVSSPEASSTHARLTWHSTERERERERVKNCLVMG
ncbi:unnamed protein product [Linum trigynum]|uniref:Uncharacterized protein n=1 Tax=Linum trigynum TaxID=586398 RepID=A0AAV2C9F3_9ROSI